MKVGAVIVCAGSGRRLGRPKAGLLLAGLPLFAYSLNTFLEISKIKQIVLVFRKKDFKVTEEFSRNKKITFARGGRTRKDSVLNGLSRLGKDIDYVLIHDCARPFVKRKEISKIIKELAGHPAVIPGIRPADSLKEARRGAVKKTLNRKNIFLAQTPQGFKTELLSRAYKNQSSEGITDSSALLELAGVPVKIIEGDRLNFKITYSEDFKLAEAVKKNYEKL